MDLPLTPPTDSLYKFLAITGIVLIVLGLVVPYRQSLEIDEQISQAWQDQKITQTDEAYLNKHVNRTLSSSSYLDDRKRPATTQEVIALREESEKEDENLRNIEVAEIKVDTAIRHIVSLNRTLRQNMIIFFTMAGSGFLLLIAGMWWWYFKIQRNEDRLLQLEVSKAEREEKEAETKVESS